MAAAATQSIIRPWAMEADLLRCPGCHRTLREQEDGLACEGCATAYPVRDGVLVVKEQATADNKIAADFYNSRLWPKFRFWERFFWFCNGGERKSRFEVLKHLPK